MELIATCARRKISHARRADAGDSRFLLHDEFPERQMFSPLAYEGTSVTLHLYVDDVDTVFQAAVDAGAEVVMPLEDCFWGDRYGILKDPFGHRWSVATRLKDLSPAELQQQARNWASSDSRASEFSRRAGECPARHHEFQIAALEFSSPVDMCSFVSMLNP